MAYKLTPYDRRVQAQLIRAEREARYLKNKPFAQRVAKADTKKKSEASGATKALHTAGDVAANLVTGAAKGLEGIYDLGAGLVGAVGGLFSDKFEDDVKAHVAKDHVGEWFGNAWQEGLDQSLLNDSTVGGIIEGVAQGVGQMLPAVAVTLIPGVGPALGAKLALGTTMASAAGTGTEQAFADGAGYGQGLTYGAASGAIEGVTEKLLPGAGDLYGKALTKMGKRAVKEVGAEVAEVGIKRAAKEALGEGAEEVLAELANPALKSIYKGRDALEEYGDSEYWKGVAEAGIVGMGTSAAYGGTVGRMTKTTGKYADARATLEHIEEQQKLRSRADLSQAERVQIEQNIKADNEQFSNRLRKLSDKGRAAVFEKMPQLKLMFDADGSINKTQLAALDANIKAAGDGTFDVRYRSSTLSADTIKAALENGSTKAHEMRAFTGETSEEQNRALGEVYEIMGAVGERSGNALGGFVITETSPEGGAYFDPNTRVIMIGADVLKSGNVTDAVTRALENDGTLGTIVHEVAHGIEETNAGKALAKVLTDDADLHDLAITDVLERGYLKEFFAENGKEADVDTVRRGIERLIERENAGEMLTEGEQAALDEYRSEVAAFANQRLLGNKSFIKKLITTEPTTAEKLIGKIREVQENLKARKDPAAKKQLELVRKAEKLFMQGLSEAGGVIDANGKIHIANREDDENKNAAETVDEKSRVRYNKHSTYVQWKSDAMAWANKHDTEIGDRGFGSDGEYYYFYEAIDPYKRGRASDYKVLFEISANDEMLAKRLCEEVTKNNGRNLEVLRGDIGRYRDARKNHHSDNANAKRSTGSHGRTGELDRGKSSQNGKRGYQKGDRPVHFHFDEDGTEHVTYASGRREVKRSRTASGDVVTLSKGQLAKLKANYHGEKVFDKPKIVEALMDIECMEHLKPATVNRLVDELWKGFNGRLGASGYQLQAQVVWDTIHTAIIEEAGDYLLDQEYRFKEPVLMKMEMQITNALERIVREARPSKAAQQKAATDKLREQAAYWRDEHTRVVERTKALPKLSYALQRLADMKKGRYVNAAQYQGDTFSVAVKELARMNWRGSVVNDNTIRKHFDTLAKWYTKENPIYKGDGGGNTRFRQDISDALNGLGNGQNGALTVEDLHTAEAVVKYFINEVESYGTVWKDGKREDAVPYVKEYIDKINRAKELAVKCGAWQNLVRSGFARMVADPAMLMRQADGYLSGFFTEQHEQLRQGTIDANVKERELSEEFEKFWEEHKAYGKRYNNATVKFGDVEMPLQEGISLYMTMHREHAFAGLAGAGFEIDGKKAKEDISGGFIEELQKQINADINALTPEEFLTLTKKRNAEIEQAALEKVIKAKREALFGQFTAEDKALIEIMERGYEACREIKIEIDNILQGDSNVTGGYYYPIRRTGLAEEVDAYTGFEGDRVSNLSMNRETVKNAHKLFIEPAHIVFMRHLKATSLYHGLGVFTDNFNRLFNLNIGSNINNPITVGTAIARSNKFTAEMIKYFKELKQDVEGISKKSSQEKWGDDAVAFIRSGYATYQLGANPKVWVTQLSSLLAAGNLIDFDCIVKGFAVKSKDVDEYCPLAWLRNKDNAAAMAQAVSTPQNAVQRAGRGALQWVRDVAMLPIGKVDRFVIKILFGACQVQVEKNGGAKVGTKENKIEAGKKLQRLILETQQNSLATERSAAMRSANDLWKAGTMFSADAMKVGARFVDAWGERAVLRTRLREARKAGDTAEIQQLEKSIARVNKQCARSSSVLVGVALFNALLAYFFKWLYRRDEEESVGTVLADTVGNMLGGIPIVRDVWGFMQDGFEIDNFLFSTMNDVLGAAADSFQLVRDAASGKEVTKQEALANMRKIVYGMGQLSGVPTRNLYNVVTGAINRVSPTTGYKVESQFYKQPFSSDLEKAIAADDEKMIGTIAGLMIDEKIGIEDDKMRDVLRNLAGAGYSVLPRSVGDSVTVNGEEHALTGRQQKRLRTVYAVGEEAVADMCKLKQFAEADDEAQAKAIQFVYGVYWDLAVEDVLGVELAEKNVLFAEAIDIEKLAIIIAQARSLDADKDKDGKAIAGTKKRKVERFVASLRLTAAQKYMVMGYLGYTNANGRAQVESYIGGLKLTKTEKAALLKYSGYAA